MAIREIVVREGEVVVKMDGILTAEDLERVQAQIYYNEEFIKQLNRQTFDYSGITDSTLTNSQIFYLSAMDNSALLTNPKLEIMKIASSDKIIKLYNQWHQNLIIRSNVKILLDWRCRGVNCLLKSLRRPGPARSRWSAKPKFPYSSL